MNASQSILELYKQSLVLSNECLLLAKKAEWDKLIDFSHRYITTVEKLSQLSLSENIQLPSDARQKIKIMLQQILNNEVEIKQLLQARMSELKGLINVTSQQHSVNATYNKFSDKKSFLAGKVNADD
ncbi:flagellar protein FliT [Brenneria goodwinii]|uniref:flagellar protein FliT n=1 Tax=Brenneria goodwinii TaxID=1109412 RepID=UPI0036EE0FB2